MHAGDDRCGSCDDGESSADLFYSEAACVMRRGRRGRPYDRQGKGKRKAVAWPLVVMRGSRVGRAVPSDWLRGGLVPD